MTVPGMLPGDNTGNASYCFKQPPTWSDRSSLSVGCADYPVSSVKNILYFPDCTEKTEVNYISLFLFCFKLGAGVQGFARVDGRYEGMRR